MTGEEYKKLTIKEFNHAAEKFDDSDPSVYNLCRKDYPDVLAEVTKEPCTDLLDAGCGTGSMLGLFLKDCPEKNYTGIDLSESMIRAAKSKGLSKVNFVVGDCENLPFEADSFDVVTCSMSFHHYPDPEKFFLSLAKVLRPGGRFILRDMASKSNGMMWFFNHIEIPFLNKLCKKGDVEVIGVTDKAVSRWERGKGFPDINTLQPLAAALEVSVLELMRSKKDEMKDMKNNNVSAEELTELMNHAVEMEKEGQKQDRMLTWMIVPIVIAVAILVKLNTASSVLGSVFVGCFVAFPVAGIYLLLRSQHDKDGQRIYSVFVVIGIGILIGVLQVIGCKASWLIWGVYVVLSFVIGILNK